MKEDTSPQYIKNKESSDNWKESPMNEFTLNFGRYDKKSIQDVPLSYLVYLNTPPGARFLNAAQQTIVRRLLWKEIKNNQYDLQPAS